MKIENEINALKRQLRQAYLRLLRSFKKILKKPITWKILVFILKVIIWIASMSKEHE